MVTRRPGGIQSIGGFVCGCSCHTPPPLCCSLPSTWWDSDRGPLPAPAARASPAASRLPPQSRTDHHPLLSSPSSPPLLQLVEAQLLLHRSPPNPLSKSKSRLWGGASPWRAPRCACTLAVTCQPGEQRFRCVRGVRAHPRAPVTCHHCATMPNWCYIPLLLFQPSLIFR